MLERGNSRRPRSSDGDREPAGVFESIRRVRGAAGRLAQAHIDLLKAELAVTAQELGLILGLALVALLLAFLLLCLLYVGTFLFLGEWLFGSIAWGIVHGSLLTVLFVVPIALNLGGGWMGAYPRGFLAGLGVTVLLSLVFGSNLLRNAAVAAGEWAAPSLALDPASLPTLIGLLAGAVVGGVILWLIGLRVGGAIRLALVGLAVGAVLGAILGSVTFDWKGAIAVALTIGLVTWLAVTALLAVRRGFDPERRYARLVPRESIAAFEESRSFVQQQMRRQRGRMLGR
jgi:hypothetical protein